MSTLQASSTYSTRDFYSAAFLLTLDGVRLVDVVWEGRRATFQFSADNGIDFKIMLRSLRDGSATVIAKEFIGAIQDLKGELFDRP